MNHKRFIEFIKIDEEDGMLCIDASASNGFFSSNSSGFWVYPEDVIRFGKQLQKFPKHRDIHDEVVLSYGNDEGGGCGYLFLRVYIYDHVGHAGIEVKMRQNPIEGDTYGRLDAAQAHFIIPTLVARINDLGRAIVNWVKSKEEKLLYSL